MRRIVFTSLLTVAGWGLSAAPAAAQFIGTFTWQSAPFCNVITLNVTQVGTSFALDGFDNLCGAERRATVTGQATINPNASVGLGLTIVNPQVATEVTHMDITLDVATLGGTWVDSHRQTGTWVFNGAGGGNLRPTGQLFLTRFNEAPAVVGQRASGTPAAPTAVTAGDPILFLGARGHVGTGFSGASMAQILLTANQNWTATARGTRIDFLTTLDGTDDPDTRMRIDHNGRVGIGTSGPLNLLDVAGDIRIGTGTLGCVLDRDGDAITGLCSSDSRFKRDVVSFGSMLNKVAALRPVHYYWRADEFPSRNFGSRQASGLMAQEVEEILPELVTTDAEGFKAVNYSKLPLLALQAIKELKAKNDALEAQNEAFERRLAELEARVKQ